LGAALLRYMLYGKEPSIPPTEVQAMQLLPLMRLLELEGYSCSTIEHVPLRVRGARYVVDVGTYPALLSEQHAALIHPVSRDRQIERFCLIPDYLVPRNLSLVYKKVRDCMES